MLKSGRERLGSRSDCECQRPMPGQFRVWEGFGNPGRLVFRDYDPVGDTGDSDPVGGVCVQDLKGSRSAPRHLSHDQTGV